MATWTSKANAPVLQAEDDEHDVFFMQRAFAQVGVTQPLVALPGGQEGVSKV
ncbi:MAG TPA: hypothetical protein VNZ22_10720 [Bacillota bacterium]|nr:hypothetical protein [Bacillota bacterium]